MYLCHGNLWLGLAALGTCRFAFLVKLGLVARTTVTTSGFWKKETRWHLLRDAITIEGGYSIKQLSGAPRSSFSKKQCLAPCYLGCSLLHVLSKTAFKEICLVHFPPLAPSCSEPESRACLSSHSVADCFNHRSADWTRNVAMAAHSDSALVCLPKPR